MPLTLGVSWADAVTLVESEALASVGVSKIGDLVALYDSFAKGQVSLARARALTPTPTLILARARALALTPTLTRSDLATSGIGR